MQGTNECERCEVEYDAYLVLIRDHISDIVGFLTCEYDHLCKPCRMHIADYGAYLTESEQEELEPKVNVQ